MKCIECNEVKLKKHQLKYCGVKCRIIASDRGSSKKHETIGLAWGHRSDQQRLLHIATCGTELGFISGKALALRDKELGRDYSKRRLN